MSARDRSPSALRTTEREIATFTGGAVVQLAAGEPACGDAVVTPIAPATVRLTDRRVIGDVDGTEWSWMLDELIDVRHGVDPWTILAVPGISDHGISVPDHHAERFRRELQRARGGGPGAEGREVLDLTDGGRGEPDDVTRPMAAITTAPPLPPSDPAPPGGAERPADPTVATTVTAPVVDALVEPAQPIPAAPLRRTGVLARVADGIAGRRASSSTGSRHAGANAPREALLAALETRDVSAWFGTHHVLDRVSLRMEPGKVTALIGPSGCGKSTYLRILNRMHEMIPSASLAGEVLLDGQDIYDPDRRLTDARRQIGMVFQKPNPFPAMSIYDNVVASFRLTGTKADQEERDDVVESCLRKAGLWTEVRDRLRQPGGGLSGGQQQRLCIARALAIRPRVLLMDEPCSALDPTSTRRIEQTIQELANEVTMVIVTHNMQQAARVSHQCAFFLAEQGTPGVVVEHGPTEAMFDSPQDQRTLDYVTGRFG